MLESIVQITECSFYMVLQVFSQLGDKQGICFYLHRNTDTLRTANKHVKQIYLDHMDAKILKMGSISGLSLKVQGTTQDRNMLDVLVFL